MNRFIDILKFFLLHVSWICFEWKSKGLSSEIFKAISTSDNSLNPTLNYYGTKIRVKFPGFIVYSLGASSSNYNDPTLKNCLFSAVTLTKNADIDKYGYFGYGLGFDRRGSFSFPGSGFGQNVIIFAVDMSSSAHINNKKKDMLILGVGPTQVLEHTLTAEKMYSINFTITNI